MPSLRRNGFGDTARLTETGHIPAAPWATGRSATPAEAQRRYRSGHRSPHGPNLDPVWEERRNGLPFRPYTYRGTGADAYTGEVVVL